MKKQSFLALVVEEMSQHPDWLRDLQGAIQEGIMSAIERKDVLISDLSIGVVLVTDCKKQIVKNRTMLDKWLKALLHCFDTAPIAKEIKELIDQ